MEKHIFVLYRENKGLTQAELARKLGVSRGMVSLIESGERTITAEKANAWAALLGLNRCMLNPIFAQSVRHNRKGSQWSITAALRIDHKLPSGVRVVK
jgi:transcriptional regulator with XRE-family HTH domain